MSVVFPPMLCYTKEKKGKTCYTNLYVASPLNAEGKISIGDINVHGGGRGRPPPLRV